MKQSIKKLLFFTGKHIHFNDDSKVIYYHDIHDIHCYTSMSTSLELFKKHINIIKKRGYIVVSGIKNKKKEIEITFDDGFRGIYENFIFFEENKLPLKLFMITDYIDKKNYLTKTEINEMLKTGLLTIGSHTKSHRNLSTLSIKEEKKEIGESKLILEDLFGVAVDSICYPRGKFRDSTIELAKEYGYKKQYSCLPGSYFKPFREGMINRSLVQHATEFEFEAILYGADRLFHRRYLSQQYSKDTKR